jgi:hypothetical protein
MSRAGSGPLGKINRELGLALAATYSWLVRVPAHLPETNFRAVSQLTHTYGKVNINSRERMQEGTVTTRSVRQVCEAGFDAHQHDCSGFARAVASELNVPLQGLANDIVETLRTSPDWTRLRDGSAAAESAKAGKLVIGGLKGGEQAHPDPHGHVVVVVEGPLNRNAYPSAYWGRLGGGGAKDKTINYAWRPEDRDRVSYAAHNIPDTGN